MKRTTLCEATDPHPSKRGKQTEYGISTPRVGAEPALDGMALRLKLCCKVKMP